jgi:UDP-glucose 4-epimerase
MTYKGRDYKVIGKVVVVGGSGFMGSHVADCLSDNGYQVTIFDQIYSPWLRADQKMVVGDILDEEVLERTIKGARFVYNFAALADLNQALNQPVKTVKN